VKDNELKIIYQQLKADFKQAGIGEAGLEAQLLLEWAADLSYKDIITDPDRRLNGAELTQLQQGLVRRLRGESIHRIRGWREFYGLPFQLSPDTLEPRPDSETLIDLILPVIRALARQQEKIALLDMGTGSGALAITLLVHVPQLIATAVDIASGALEVAARNARQNGVAARFQPLLSDGFAKVEGKYDFIISNPPYIARPQILELDKTVRDFDPVVALDGGEDGLDFYRQLALMSRDFLNPSGQICVEIGQGQEAQIKALFAAQGFCLIAQQDDLAGICRVLMFKPCSDHPLF